MQLKKISDLSICTLTIETCVAEIKLNSEIFILFAIYRPHSDSIDNFPRQLSLMLHSPLLYRKSVILIGDVNVDLLMHSTESVMEFVNTMQSLSFIPAITKPTRFPEGDGKGDPSLLDHIWVNTLSCFKSGILTVDITDHCPIFIQLPVSLKQKAGIKLTFRVHTPRNIELFKEEVRRCLSGWNFRGDVNVVFDAFSENINNIYSNYFPIKVKYISTKRICKPWLTTEILKSIRKKAQYLSYVKWAL